MKLRTGLKLLPVLGTLAAPLAFDGVRSAGNEEISEVIAGVATAYQSHFVDNADKAHFEGNKRDIVEHSAKEAVEKGFFYSAAQRYLELSDREKARSAYEKFVEEMEADSEKFGSNLPYLKTAYTFLGETNKVTELDLRLKGAEGWQAEKEKDYDRAIVLYAEIGDEALVKRVKEEKAKDLIKEEYYKDAASLFEEIGMLKEAQAAYKRAGEKFLYNEELARELFTTAGLPKEEIDTILSEYNSKQKASTAAFMREARANEPQRKKEEREREEENERWKAESLIRADAYLAEGDLDNATFAYNFAGWTNEQAKAKVDPLKRQEAERAASNNTPLEKIRAAGLYRQIGELDRASALFQEAAKSFERDHDFESAAAAYSEGGDKVAASNAYRVLGNMALQLDNNCTRALDYYNYAAKSYPPFLGYGNYSLSTPLREAAECAAERTFESQGWRGETMVEEQLESGGYSEEAIARWQGDHWLETDPYRALRYYKDAKTCPQIINASLAVYESDMTSCMNHNGFWNLSQCSYDGRNLYPFQEIADCL